MTRKTQVNSFKKLKPTLKGKRKQVYDIIAKHSKIRTGGMLAPGQRWTAARNGVGLTSREIAAKLNWEINRVTGRVTELVNLGKVTTGGTTWVMDTNRTVTLWQAI